jgi:glycosidase
MIQKPSRSEFLRLAGATAVLCSGLGCSGLGHWSKDVYHDLALGHRSKEAESWYMNRTLYEANPYFSTAHSSLSELSAELARLAALGIGILYVMPIYVRGGPSMYCVRNYKAVDPELGTLADLRSLVSAAHSRDIKVILDFVPNHTSLDHPWIKQHPDWYKRDANGNIIRPWQDVAQLDWSKQPLWAAMKDAVLFWAREANVDGFRWDVAGRIPRDWYRQVREELQLIKPVFLLAEGDEPDLYPTADITYSFGLPEVWRRIAAGGAATELDSYLAKESKYPAGAIRMRYTATHDTSYRGQSTFRNYGGEAGAKAFAVVATTMKGKPMIYSGQECGIEGPLEHDNRVTTNPNYLSSPWRSFYTKLLNLHQNNPALHSGSFVKLATNNNSKLYAFGRQSGARKVVVIANLSPASRSASVRIPSAYRGTYTNLFSGARQALGATYNFSCPAWNYRIFHV